VSEPILKLQRDGALVTITLNRPERRNALDKEMVDAFHHVLDAAWEDDSIGAAIITGAGDQAFVSGADIAELKERRRREALQSINSRLFQRIEDLPFPTIAAIRGFALGGGCELALACDLRVAGEGARLGQPEVGLGIIPGAGATYRLPRIVGLARAREMIFTARIIDAREALAIGLVNQVVPDSEVLPAANSLAQSILRQDPLAVRLAKMAFRIDGGSRPGAGFLAEALAQGILFDSDEKTRRMTEFLEKRTRKK